MVELEIGHLLGLAPEVLTRQPRSPAVSRTRRDFSKKGVEISALGPEFRQVEGDRIEGRDRNPIARGEAPDFDPGAAP